VYSTSEYEHEYSSIVSVCILPVNIAPVIIVPMGILPMSIVPVGTVLLRTSVSSSKYYTVYISTSPLPPLPPLPLHIPPITSYHTLGIPVRLHIRLHTNTHHPGQGSLPPSPLPISRGTSARQEGWKGWAGGRPAGWGSEWSLDYGVGFGFGTALLYSQQTAAATQQPHRRHTANCQHTS
jgi:hypothetical protein